MRRHVPLVVACAALTLGLVACDGEITVPSELPSLSRSVSRSVEPSESTTEPAPTSKPTSDTSAASPTRTTTTSETTTSETTTSDPTTETETETRIETKTKTETTPGSASTDGPTDEGSEPPWVVLGLLGLIAALGAFLLLRRRSSEVSVTDAYRAAADVRDRVSAAVSRGPSIDAFGLLAQIDAADLTIRNARSTAKPDDTIALDRLVLAVAGLRSSVEATAAGRAGAHAADTEADVLRALAELNAALSEVSPGAP